MTDSPIHIDTGMLKAGVASRYLVSRDADWTPIFNGDECLVWRVSGAGHAFIIRVSPAWRSPAELQWTHELVAHCAATIPQAVAPLMANDGSSCFVLDEYPVTVYPFVKGAKPDRTNPLLVDQAARLLARIHRAALAWPGTRPRPASNTSRPGMLGQEALPAQFRDPAFDAWEAALPKRKLATGPIHGDYYPRNLLASRSAIDGVIDWDEAKISWLMAETAWAAWEFSQNDAGDDLDMTRAAAFFAAYFDEDPPCLRDELRDAVNFIRLRLRDEVAMNLARREQGENWTPEDQEYADAETRAFAALQDRVAIRI